MPDEPKTLRPILEDSVTRRELIRQAAVSGLSKAFPMKAGKWTLELSGARVEPRTFSSREQKMAILEGRTLSERVRGDLTVKNAQGEVASQSKGFTLLHLPYFTPRHTFILDGTEYSVSNQLRTKPGVYVRRRGNEELEAAFNLSKGANFKIMMEPEKGLLYMQPGHTTARVALYPVLRALDVPHQDIAKGWGSEVAAINRDSFKSPDSHINRLYESVIHPAKQTHDTPEARAGAIREYLNTTSMDPEVTRVTLGAPFDKASGLAMLAASNKILDVHRKSADVDDRDSLSFKTFHSVDDFIKERLQLDARAMRNKLGWKLDASHGAIKQALPAAPFTRAVTGFLTTSSLSAVPVQINPMELIDEASRVTMLGEGAIASERAIPLEARDVHATHFGIIDPVRVPESFKVGVDLRMGIGSRRDNEGNLYAPVHNIRTGKDEYLKSSDLAKSVVAFPGNIDLHAGKMIDAMKDGLVQRVPASEITHQLRHASDMYGATTNLLPLLNGMQGNRALMASKHQGQALPLIHREAPLVQVESWNPGVSVEREMVRLIVPTAPSAGHIEKIDEDYIHFVPDAKAEKHAAEGTMQLHYDSDLPLAAKTYLDNKLTVKAGDRVTAGQPLADSNFTKDGVLALGTNLRVAYMPYRGLNTNDGIVISQSAANKLTSEHMFHHVLDKSGDVETSREKHRAYFGGRYSAKQYDALDESGVARPGTVLQKGDPIMIGVRPETASGDAALLGKLSKSLVKPYAEIVETWTHEQPGIVTDVSKTAGRHSVTVKTKETMQIGDKTSNRYGAKGVIAKIIPDHQMIQDEKGRPIDIILTSAGIITRINPAQIVEASLGKVAEHTGKPILVPQFAARDAIAHAKSLLKEHGLSDKETVTDPITGRKIPGVFVGKSYFLKLFKTTDTNWAAHGAEKYDYNQQPAKGGDDGAKGIGKMEFDGLVAHNARAVLQEAAAIKSQRNDEFWRAVQLGTPTPAPRTPFAYDKLHSMLTGAGVKISKEGSRLSLGPLTDADILRMSAGELPDPSKMIRAKDLKPETGGMFDPTKTGGMSGTKWSHVELSEPIVNPVFAEPVRRLLGLTQKDFTEKTGHGGHWFRSELEKIDVPSKLAELRERSKKLRGAALDDTIKQAKYLSALETHGLKPADAYVLSKIPVTPPVIRPILPLKDGRLQVGDANLLYRDAFLANDKLKESSAVLPGSELHAPRQHLYDAVSALFGIGDPVSPGIERRGAKGYIATITGSRPGSGFFQSKLLKRQQDPSGRATISPDPTLSMDEVGIPEEMLHRMYDKFVIGRLVKRGYSALDAQKMVDEHHPLAHDELINESRERPVIINRAPSLTRHNLIGAYPKLIKGKTIGLNPFMERGLNADFDGDYQLATVIINITHQDYNHITTSRDWWQEREVPFDMSSHFTEVIGYAKDDHFFICALEDFPHGELQHEHEHRSFYDVPDSIRVLTYEAHTGRVRLAKPLSWSVHKDRVVEIVTLKSGRQIITDDDPRAVYGLDEDLETVLKRPCDSIGVFVPVARHLSPLEPYKHNLENNLSPRRRDRSGKINKREKRMYNNIALTEKFGQLCGMLVGDGWVDIVDNQPKAVHLAAIEPSIQNTYKNLVEGLFTVKPTINHNHREEDGYGTNSQKLSITSVEYASLISPLIGHKAQNKHLPPFFLFTPEEYRKGLLAGLLDTDGSISINHINGKPRWMVNHSTTSIRLAQEIVLLYKSLNIVASITSTKTSLGNKCWTINPSSVELKCLKKLPISHQEKSKRFERFFAEEVTIPKGSYASTDLIPTPENLILTIRGLYSSKAALYYTISGALKRKYLTRQTATRVLIEHPNIRNNPDFTTWCKLVDNESVSWEPVVSYETTNNKETGYDLTIPGLETFMSVDGTILSNTIQVHAPVTPAGIEDVKRMTLSHQIFADRRPGMLNVAPDMEAVLGLHRATQQASSKPAKTFDTLQEARAAYNRGDIELNDAVHITE